MDTSRMLAQTLLGVTFLGAGGAKLAGGMKDEFERFGYPQWLRIATGLAETTGAVGMLAGVRAPRLAVPSGALLGGAMTGALWSHLARADDPPLRVLPPLVLLALSAWVATRK